jgi:hypothetical protein
MPMHHAVTPSAPMPAHHAATSESGHHMR